MKEIFSPRVEIESREEKINVSVFSKKSNSHSFRGWFLARMKEVFKQNPETKYTNMELCQILKEIYDKFLEFETKARLNLRGWKGKSSFEVIRKPDSFDVVVYRKFDQESEPKKIIRNITKKEVNDVILVLKELDIGKRIKTRYIGETLYGQKWDEVFSDRFEHTQLNYILRLLDYYGFLHYRGGYSQVLDKFKEIQTILK